MLNLFLKDRFLAVDAGERCHDILCNKCLIYIYISHHSISSQSSSIAGDETVLFIVMVTALQQTDQEENRDVSNNMKQLLQSYADAGQNKKFQESLVCSRLVLWQEIFIRSTAEASVIMLSYLCKTTKAGMKLGYYIKKEVK